MNVYKWLGIALAFSLVLGWGVWQRGDRLYYEGENKRLVEVVKSQDTKIKQQNTELKNALDANSSLITQNVNLGKADDKIDIQYRDRYRTIEKIVREGDTVGANAVLRSLIEGFYDSPEAPPTPTKGG